MANMYLFCHIKNVNISDNWVISIHANYNFPKKGILGNHAIIP